jgi:hypothetical protein
MKESKNLTENKKTDYEKKNIIFNNGSGYIRNCNIAKLQR